MHHFTWPSWLLPRFAEYDHTMTATLVVLALFVWALVAKRQLDNTSDPVIPDDRITARNSVEIFVDWLVGFSESILGPKGRNLVPIYGTFFLFILAMNLTGLIPGFSPPTSNFNISFALGVTSFFLYNYLGFREGGLGYLKHFLGPVAMIAPLFLVLEIIDNLVRPASLGLRLFGNMTGDHVVLGIFTDLVPIGVPVVFLALGAFVSLVQAFVFTALSLVYVALATEGHDEHH